MREPLLVTERTVLRLAAPSDAGAVAAYAERNADHFERWIVFDRSLVRPEAALLRIQSNRAEFAAGTSCKLYIFDRLETDTVIGAANLFGIMRGAFQASYLGYHVDRAYEGRGLMHEALSALLTFAFDEVPLHRVMAAHAVWNDRSRKVLERLRFVREGYAERYLLLNGVWEDHVLWAQTSENWTKSLGEQGGFSERAKSGGTEHRPPRYSRESEKSMAAEDVAKFEAILKEVRQKLESGAKLETAEIEELGRHFARLTVRLAGPQRPQWE